MLDLTRLRSERKITMAFIKDGTEGSPANPIYVQPTDGNGGNGQTDAQLLEGDAHIGHAGMAFTCITVNPTIGTSYDDGMVMGGLQVIPNAVRQPGDCLMFQSLTVLAEVQSTYRIIFFRDNPVNANTDDGDTFAFNNSRPLYIGSFEVSAGQQIDTVSWGQISSEWFAIMSLDTTTLYFVIVPVSNGGSITLTDPQGLLLTLGFQR